MTTGARAVQLGDGNLASIEQTAPAYRPPSSRRAPTKSESSSNQLSPGSTKAREGNHVQTGTIIALPYYWLFPALGGFPRQQPGDRRPDRQQQLATVEQIDSSKLQSGEYQPDWCQ